MKKIWLVYPYGNIPGEGLRPDRSQMIVESIRKDGYEITTWVSSFDHTKKTQRKIENNVLSIDENISIKIVQTIGYRKNISIKRIFSELLFGFNLWKISNKIEKPDVIIITEPSLFFGKLVLRIIKNKRCNIIIDMQDLWPEIFKIVLPIKLRVFEYILFKPLYKMREKTFSSANAIIAVSDTYRNKAMKLAPQIELNKFKTVYYSVDIKKFRSSMLEVSEFGTRFSKNNDPNELRIIFASTLGDNYDITTILNASAKLSKLNICFRLLIAGSGPLETLILNYLHTNPGIKVEYLGNPNSNDLCVIYKYCHIGLSSYKKDSPVSIPIKAFHYSAAGLAVINSLEGEYAEILSINNAGLNYKSGDVDSLINSVLCYSKNPILLNQARLASFELGQKFDSHYQYAKIASLIRNLNNNI